MKWTTTIAILVFTASTAQAESWTRLNTILGIQHKVETAPAPEAKIVESAPMVKGSCDCKSGCGKCREQERHGVGQTYGELPSPDGDRQSRGHLGFGGRPCGLKVRKFSFQNNWMIGCGKGCTPIKRFRFDCNKMIGCGTCRGGYGYECGTAPRACGGCGMKGCGGCGTKGKRFNLYWMHGGSYKPLGTKSCGASDARNYLKFRLHKAFHGCGHGCCKSGCSSCGGHGHAGHGHSHDGTVIEETAPITPPTPATEAPMERAA